MFSTVKDFPCIWVTILSALIQIAARKAYSNATLWFWESKCKENDVPATMKKYGLKSMKNSFKLVWHAVMIYYGWSLISNSLLHHFFLRGKQKTWRGIY